MSLRCSCCMCRTWAPGALPSWSSTSTCIRSFTLVGPIQHPHAAVAAKDKPGAVVLENVETAHPFTPSLNYRDQTVGNRVSSAVDGGGASPLSTTRVSHLRFADACCCAAAGRKRAGDSAGEARREGRRGRRGGFLQRGRRDDNQGEVRRLKNKQRVPFTRRSSRKGRGKHLKLRLR